MLLNSHLIAHDTWKTLVHPKKNPLTKKMKARASGPLSQSFSL